MKYIRVASKLARVAKEINLAILTLKIDKKFLKSPIITEMSEFAFFNFHNIPTRSNPVKIHLNLPAFCSTIQNNNSDQRYMFESKNVVFSSPLVALAQKAYHVMA